MEAPESLSDVWERPETDRSDQRGELVVVTGMTGAGRSTAAKELEDLGFYVVDNMPPTLLKDVVRLVDESRGVEQPIAVVVDVRSGSFFDSLHANLAQGATGRHVPRWCSSRPPTTCWSAARRPRAARTPCRATAGCSTGSSGSGSSWPACAATPTWSSTPPTSTSTSSPTGSPRRSALPRRSRSR